MAKPIKIKSFSKAIILGAGFDMNFGIPTWQEYVVGFGNFVSSMATKDIDIAKLKVKYIISDHSSLSRKLGMIDKVAQNHMENDNGDALKIYSKCVLNIDSYSLDTIDLENSFYEVASSDRRIKVATTNFSNVLKKIGFSLIEKISSPDNHSYFPIHGSFFENSQQNTALEEIIIPTIAKESEYISSTLYPNKLTILSQFLEDVSEIILFGYSIQDENILKKIKNSNITNLTIFFGYKDIHWKEILEDFYADVFDGEDIKITNKGVHIIDGDYKSMFQEFIEYIDQANKSINTSGLDFLKVDNNE